uniref:Beta'-coat protein n=2 Tax=Cannabis sativa TaxID=3483 RepID=A0A803NZY6_CANSA
MEFAQNSERVKSVDVHPTHPWILTSLYSGTVTIWNHQSQKLEKSFEVTNSPVRSAKFIASKNWIVTGSDDGFIRVYNYETMEKIIEVEAHKDFIRCVVVHPNLPYLVSSSDDKSIKLWDWEKGWICTQIFEGHSHYVMQVAFNPNDSNIFTSASLDGTIMTWNIGSPTPKFTLNGHLKGVNCIVYFNSGDKTYLLSGSDDFTAKIWDCETQTCVQTLEGHLHNVSALCVLPELSIVITASEDGTARLWHTFTYKLENTFNYDLGRVWAVGSIKGNQVIFGFDKGFCIVKIMNGGDSVSSGQA